MSQGQSCWGIGTLCSPEGSIQAFGFEKQCLLTEPCGKRAFPCWSPVSQPPPQTGVLERFTHGQEQLFDWASKDQTRWNISECNRKLAVRERHAMNLLQMTSPWPMLMARACCKPSEPKSLVLPGSKYTTKDSRFTLLLRTDQTSTAERPGGTTKPATSGHLQQTHVS